MQRKTIANDLYQIEQRMRANATQQEFINLNDEESSTEEDFFLSSLARKVVEEGYETGERRARQTPVDIDSNHESADVNSNQSSDNQSTHSSSSSDESSSASATSSDSSSEENECASLASTPSEEMLSPRCNEIPSLQAESADIDLFATPVLQESALLALPQEILLALFHLLPMNDCLNLRETCRSLAEIGHDKSLGSKFGLRLDYSQQPSAGYIPLHNRVSHLCPLENNKLAVVFSDGVVGFLDLNKHNQNISSTHLILGVSTVKLLQLRNGMVVVLGGKRVVSVVNLANFPHITNREHTGFAGLIKNMVAVEDDMIAIRLRNSCDVTYYRVTHDLALTAIKRLKINKPAGTNIRRIHGLFGQHLLVCHDRYVNGSLISNANIELYHPEKGLTSLNLSLEGFLNDERMCGVISKNKFWYTDLGQVVVSDISGQGTSNITKFPISNIVPEGEAFPGMQHVNNNYFIIPANDKDPLVTYDPRNGVSKSYGSCGFGWSQSVEGLLIRMTSDASFLIFDLYNSSKNSIVPFHSVELESQIFRVHVQTMRASSTSRRDVVKMQDGRVVLPVRNLSSPQTTYGLMLFDYPARVIQRAPVKSMELTVNNSLRKSA